ncbi:MAG: type I 3-dehydroquinate dehydratase [Ruminococcaceae bacterium]|nr:type I 3-dehydroquinate dehydratase [Oscillospiraceae bacterium]
MKKSFLNHEKPLYTVMIQRETPEEAIDIIQRGTKLGADAFGLQTCKLLPEHRNLKTYKRIFDAAPDKPFYITNYRHCSNDGKSDDELGTDMVSFIKAGGTLVDIMGDLYDRHPEELTDNPEAIQKQMQLIEEIHQAGGEVLMSSHVLKFTPAERVLEIAREHVRRGADIVKIVTGAEDMTQQIENLRIVDLLKKELKVPFLYLSGGECKILRRIGGMLGCGLYLCVLEHDGTTTPTQPIFEHLKAIHENFIDEGGE